MSNVRRILCTFLASPSDLGEERVAVHRVVAQFNEIWADRLGYEVQLLGWEDTAPGSGRPQHLINRDVDRCDLFIGMLSKRWGTPPDHDSSLSSGFQEEFERSKERMEASGSPEICLFFKEIPSDFMEDPGEDLKNVLNFRQGIVDGKQFLFQKFYTVQDMEWLAQKCIAQYVNRVKAAEEYTEIDEVREKSDGPEWAETIIRATSPKSSFLSTIRLAFLEDLVGKMKQERAMDDISSSDVARFRLLANSISTSDNDKTDLGVHDINILFIARTEGLELDKRETMWLSRLGFRYLNNETVPLWCWYSDLSDDPINLAVFSSLAGVDDDEKVGAIHVLTALEHKLPVEHELVEREQILNDWFSDDSSARVKSAALAYLAKMGRSEDYAFPKREYKRDDHTGSNGTLDCMAAILLRTGRENSAQELILESPFESLDGNTLKAVLEGFDNIESSALIPGLEHRHGHVRLQTLRVLRDRGDLDQRMAERLLRDSDASVRNEALTAITELGRSFTKQEVREILVVPNRESKPGLLGMRDFPIPDRKGEEFFERYELNTLKEYPEAELTSRVQGSLLYNDHPYFARAERYLAKHVSKLREDVDDTFGTYFEEQVQRTAVAPLFSVLEVAKNAKSVEDSVRKRLTRRGLDILCRMGKREDLDRIRANLETGYTTSTGRDVEYLRKHGEWKDIPLVVGANTLILGAVLFEDGYGASQDQVSRAVIAMSRGRSVSMLLSLEMPPHILKKTIELCPKARFAKISRGTLIALLDHESKAVRKATAIKAVEVLPTTRIRSVLREYIGGETNVYYNVLHWLDLGASIPRSEVKKVVRVATSSNR